MEKQFDVIECPHCGAKHKMLKAPKKLKQFTAYSDGKTVSSELDNTLEVTCCTACDSYFWIDDAKPVAIVATDEMPAVMSLEIEDYVTILTDENTFKTTDEEEILRRELLWAFNDRVRNGQSIFENDIEQTVWKENMDVLLELLDESDVYSRMQRAEVAREIGDFELAEKILSGIKDAPLLAIKRQILNAVKHGETEVIKLEL